MSEERDLRVALREILLAQFGLLSEKPEVQRHARVPRKEKAHPTFSVGTDRVRSSGFASEPSAIPSRKRILVGTSIRMADQRRAGPGARLPGESDRDFLSRKASIRAAHSRGLAPPTTDTAPSFHDEAWEMGH